MKPRILAATRFSLPLAAALAALAAGPAQAATVYWQGGTGSWDTTSSLWGTSAAGPFSSTWGSSSGNADIAIFGGAGGAATLTIGSGIYAGGLQFNSNPYGCLYTLSGANTLTLNGPATIINTSAVTIGNNTATVLAGSAGLTKSGVGTLTLNGSAVNPWTGGLTINGGTLAEDFTNMGATANLMNSGNALTFGGGALTIKSNASNSSSQSFAGVTVNALGGSLLVNPNTKTPTVALGNITASTAGGSLQLGVTATGPILTTTSTKDATTGIYGGRVVYFNGTASTGYDFASTASGSSPYTLSAYGSYTAMVASGSSPTVNYSLTTALSGVGTETLNSLKVVGVNLTQTASTTLTIQSGGLLLASATGPTISGGNLTAGNGSGSYDLVVFQGGGYPTISSAIVNNGANAVSFVKAGPGYLTLSGTNTYTGNTYVNAGILDFGSTTPAGSTANVYVAAGALLRFTAPSTALIQRIAATSDEIGIVTSSGSSAAIDFSAASAPNAFLAGGIASNNGKTDNFTGAITPANNTYRLGFPGANGTFGVSSTLSGANGLIIGGNNVCLTAANTHSGETDIRTGAYLLLANNLALQNSPLNVGTGADTIQGLFSLAVGTGFVNANTVTNATLGGLIGSRNLLSAYTATSANFGNNATAQATTAVTGFTLNPGSSVTCTYSGVIADFAAGMTLTKTGAGTQILAGANTYSGLTTVSGGTLILTGSNICTGPTTISGGTLEIGGTGLLGVGTYAANITNTGTFRYNSTATQTLSGSISGSGGILNKDNTGKLILSNANSYSGATTISAGALVGVAGGGCVNSDVTLSPTTSGSLGVLVNDITKQWSAKSLTMAGTDPTLDFGFTVAPSTSLAPLNVAGDLTFTTTPTLTLDAANLVAGTYPLIVVGGSAPTAVPTVTITGDASAIGTLAVSTAAWGGTGNNTLSVTISGAAPGTSPYPLTWNTSTTGSWDVDATGGWQDNNLTTGVKYIEQVALGGSAVQFTDTGLTANTTVSINTTVSPASVLVNDSTYNYTFSGTGGIVGSGTLTKQGSKTLTLSTANGYSGGTTLSAGQITFGNASAFGAGKISVTGNSTLGQTAAFTLLNNLDVASGQTLTMSGITSTFNGVLSGSGTLSGFGYTLANTGNTFSGKLTIGAGTVTVKSLADAGSIELNNSTFAFTGTAATTFNTRFFNLTGTTSGGSINNNSTVPLIIKPDLSVSGSGAKQFNFSGSYTGTSTFAGKITELGGATTLGFGGSGTWYLSNTTSDFTGPATLNGMAAIASIAPYGSPCSFGKGTSGVPITIGGNNSIAPTLIYLGTGDTTDRKFTIGYSGNASGGWLYNNGTGALTFTAPTFNADPTAVFTRTLTLGGTYSGGINEIQGTIIKTVGDISLT